MHRLFGVLVVFIPVSALIGSDAVSPHASPWNVESLKAVPEMRWLDQSSPIRSLVYRNEPYEGHPTEVFAFYATPGSVSGDLSRDKDLPAVVLVHGGGGTAFAEWAWLWAKRGYAAIAMDLAGRRPPAPRFDPQTNELITGPMSDQPRERLMLAGPDQGYDQKFAVVGGGVHDDWIYHAVAAVIRGHSLVRSFPEVDADRTAVTGISWGGFLTCLTASLDDRFKAAVPVYGCGFLFEGESVQKPHIDRLAPERREEWIRLYDPSSHLAACRTPILFVNGTNDPHYPLDSYAKTYRLVPGPRQFRIEVAMKHSHPAGWAPREIGLFIDSHCRGGQPLPTVARPQVQGEQVTAECERSVPLTKGALHYTLDAGPLVDRRWQTIDAQLDGSRIIAPRPPTGTTIWLMSVTDERGAMVSSEVVFAN
jgi:dienelactone hydrolase